MEKLIELLNEYNKIQNYAPIEYYDERYDGFETNYLEFYKTTLIISKKFGFIKWLVENDKIDTECQKVLHTVRAKAEGIGLECQWYSDYESLLMILSISDTPIEDLLLYLK